VDTPINHGNSGGPLLNRCGEVVGITTAIIPDAQNIGFAIPVNLVKSVLPSLLKQGHLIRPWLGFHGQFIDEDLQSLLRIPLTTGFLVEVVEPGSPAEQAKLQGGGLELTIDDNDFLLGGDIITKLNGTALTTQENIAQALNDLKVGAEVSLTVFREGKEVEVKNTLPERPFLPNDVPSGTAYVLLSGKRTRGNARFRF
jgi:S1-C subfamily serine protease